MIVMKLVHGFPHSFTCWNASEIALEFMCVGNNIVGGGGGGGGGGGRPSSQNIGGGGGGGGAGLPLRILGGGGGGGQQCPPVLPLFILHCSFEESSLNVTPSANFYKI